MSSGCRSLARSTMAIGRRRQNARLVPAAEPLEQSYESAASIRRLATAAAKLSSQRLRPFRPSSSACSGGRCARANSRRLVVQARVARNRPRDCSANCATVGALAATRRRSQPRDHARSPTMSRLQAARRRSWRRHGVAMAACGGDWGGDGVSWRRLERTLQQRAVVHRARRHARHRSTRTRRSDLRIVD